MSERAPRGSITSTPRPRDRKQQIVKSAGDLFYRHGYHNVGTEQIARSVGITAGALYRHFRGKQELLGSALTDAFEQATAFVQETSPTTLEHMVEGLADTAGTRRYLGVLWNREARHLDDEPRAFMRQRFFGFLAEFREHLARSRPDLSPVDADLLSWCSLGVLTSPSYHRTEMDQDALIELLKRLTFAVCTAPLPVPGVAPTDNGRGAAGLVPHGRRELILAAATKLFHDRGYQAVTMGDVGVAVGMTSAGVYKHFDSKADLLSAVIARASEPLQLGLTRALASASTPAEGLLNVLDAYIDFASVHHDLVGILIAEITNLPDTHRHDVRRAQHDYVAEWIKLVCDARSDLDARTARFVVQAVMTVVNDVVRTTHLRDRPQVGAELRLIGRRVLAAA
ncbi:MAG TPA: TetR family transcriptional regulator [Nocardioidaceae bacterium]|nr:TetR family transcriptional regulator [Nocardioidaceae bacterium]